MFEIILSNICVFLHKLQCQYKSYDIGNDKRVVIECGCGQYWAWNRKLKYKKAKSFYD